MAPRNAAGERKVLDYHDVLLRAADVDLLRGPEWLNDQVIAFHQEYLARECFGAPLTDVLLISGATSFLLLQCDQATAASIIEPLQPASKSLVLFAVNDNPHVDAASGGSHWSLLAYDRASNTFRHYDSCNASNARHAKRLATILGPALSSSSTSSSADQPPYVEVATPPQSNGYDCGIYVMALSEALATWQRAGRALPAEEAGLRAWLSAAYVAETRQRVLGVIEAMAKAQRRA